MTGSLEKELNTYIHQLNITQQKSLLGFIKTLFPSVDEDTITIEQYNKELEEVDAAIERGEFYTHEQATEIFKT